MVLGYLYALPFSMILVLGWAWVVASDEFASWAAIGFWGSVLALGSAVATHLLTQYVKSSSGTQRDAVALKFRPLLSFVQAAAIVMTLGTGAGLVATSYFLPALTIGYILPKLTAILGIATIYITFKIIRVLLSASPQPSMTVVGTIVDETQAHELWGLVKDLAAQLNTAAPHRLILTMDESICVTEADVIVDGKTLKGRTMILSLPLFKQLSVDQARAIIAHELAHFSGDDTGFALKFFPIFRGASASLEGIGKAFQALGGTAVVAGMPAVLLLRKFMEGFSTVEAQISRHAEKEADLKAAGVAGHASMVGALVLVHGLSHYWSENEKAVFASLHEEGRPTENFVQSFEKRLEKAPMASIVEGLMNSHIPHPFHSHPSLLERITYLGAQPDVIRSIDALIPGERNRLIASIPAVEQMEQNLSGQHTQHYAEISKIIKGLNAANGT